MASAPLQISLEILVWGDWSASFALLDNVSVTLFLQSTQVPKTSKKRHFGLIAPMLHLNVEVLELGLVSVWVHAWQGIIGRRSE